MFRVNLRSPDIVAIEEIQDNSGGTDDGIVAADQTFAKLIAAIQTAGGPVYDYRQINPVNDQDGGQPGGNIRVAFLFRTDRGVAFVDASGGTSTTADAVTASGDLLYSPGRIDPGNAAWTSSRKPLAGEFMWQGQKVFVIANHFNSKLGDNPLEGFRQPPVFSSELRKQQATEVLTVQSPRRQPAGERRRPRRSERLPVLRHGASPETAPLRPRRHAAGQRALLLRLRREL